MKLPFVKSKVNYKKQPTFQKFEKPAEIVMMFQSPSDVEIYYIRIKNKRG